MYASEIHCINVDYLLKYPVSTPLHFWFTPAIQLSATNIAISSIRGCQNHYVYLLQLTENINYLVSFLETEHAKNLHLFNYNKQHLDDYNQIVLFSSYVKAYLAELSVSQHLVHELLHRIEFDLLHPHKELSAEELLYLTLYLKELEQYMGAMDVLIHNYATSVDALVEGYIQLADEPTRQNFLNLRRTYLTVESNSIILQDKFFVREVLNYLCIYTPDHLSIISNVLENHPNYIDVDLTDYKVPPTGPDFPIGGPGGGEGGGGKLFPTFRRRVVVVPKRR